eukprot:TRINITY_DN4410_c0_g1_i2.p1 TRINITY_DN4410_c0_g1~~TRINITY_DN4410_c0_g1_i2.p1  ORF type:complete len:1276 (-),score=331.80 TRINITY_DN4410_c0_g1_i2:61-3729(-)
MLSEWETSLHSKPTAEPTPANSSLLQNLMALSSGTEGMDELDSLLHGLNAPPAAVPQPFAAPKPSTTAAEKAKAEKEERERAEKEAKEKVEKEAKEKAEKETKEKAEKEAKEKAEKEAKEKAEKEAKEKAEKEGEEQETKEQAEKDTPEREKLLIVPNELAALLSSPAPPPRTSISTGFSASRSGSPRSTVVFEDHLDVVFFLPGGKTFEMLVSAVECLNTYYIMLVEKFELTGAEYGLFAVGGDDMPLPVDCPILQLPYFDDCSRHDQRPRVAFRSHQEAAASASRKDKILAQEITQIIGKKVTWLSENDERYVARKQLHSYLRSIIPNMTTGLFNINLSVTATPYPKELPDKFPVRIYFEDTTLSFKSFAGTPELTVTSLIQMICRKHSQLLGQGEILPSDFLLKVCGLSEYLADDVTLGTSTYVRRVLKKKGNIEFRVLPRRLLYDEGCKDETVVEDGPSSPTAAAPAALVDVEQRDAEFYSEHASLNKFSEMKFIDMAALSAPFRVRIVGVENLTEKDVAEAIEALNTRSSTALSGGDDLSLSLSVGLYHGDRLLTPAVSSSLIPYSLNPRWGEWLEFRLPISNLPKATKLCVTLVGNINGVKDDIPLAWINFRLINFQDQLVTGLMSQKMWPNDYANPIGTTLGNSAKTGATLFVQFPEYSIPVIFHELPRVPPNDVDTLDWSRMSSVANPSDLQKVDQLIASDPLAQLTDSDLQLLWSYRHYCRSFPQALPKIMLAVNHVKISQIEESHRLLQAWAPLSAYQAMELLDAKFADARVREYAVSRLETLPHSVLPDYLLQLAQVLKYEPYHDSPLARFLLRRALECRVRTGHFLFWHLKAELHVAEITDRYSLILEAYLRACGQHRRDLGRQCEMQTHLSGCAQIVKKSTGSQADRLAALRAELHKLTFSEPLPLPLNPSFVVTGLEVERCKFMDSKKMPLWLIFTNADPFGEPIFVIFKCGDDLRQDLLTLQLLNIMDKLWQSEGLDMEMSPYGCVATGEEMGFIEVVLNSDTTANISKEYGGFSSAFAQEPLDVWLRKHNREDEMESVVDRFVRSCAGYSVATYVLGIGDRHNDNVMLSKRGNLFHIDFGHFLGHFKSWKGIRRERAAFVLTPDFAFVMGGKDSAKFKWFTDLSCQSYNILRRHAHLFINLFMMMLSTGIPELQSEQDIDFLRQALSLELTEADASKKFTKLIADCLNTKSTQINNAIHIIAHPSK